MVNCSRVCRQTEVEVDMGYGVVRHSAGLTRGRIADHGNLPEREVENVAHGAYTGACRLGRDCSKNGRCACMHYVFRIGWL
jgi:hypothetical protein